MDHRIRHHLTEFFQRYTFAILFETFTLIKHRIVKPIEALGHLFEFSIIHSPKSSLNCNVLIHVSEIELLIFFAHTGKIKQDKRKVSVYVPDHLKFFILKVDVIVIDKDISLDVLTEIFRLYVLVIKAFLKQARKPVTEETCQYQQDPDKHYNSRDDYRFLISFIHMITLQIFTIITFAKTAQTKSGPKPASVCYVFFKLLCP